MYVFARCAHPNKSASLYRLASLQRVSFSPFTYEDVSAPGRSLIGVTMPRPKRRKIVGRNSAQVTLVWNLAASSSSGACAISWEYFSLVKKKKVICNFLCIQCLLLILLQRSIGCTDEAPAIFFDCTAKSHFKQYLLGTHSSKQLLHLRTQSVTKYWGYCHC